ncbi:MAG: hypothetical protein DMD91_04960 [Candidatus Rokuibacteriota bacterium]|nr:MAG: hypothetical protein DMD91_04960 [Candidatus Rokubacteria bacterium]
MSHLKIWYVAPAVAPYVVVLEVLLVAVLDMLVVLELVPPENFDVVVPTLTSRDREGEKAILLEKVSVVVGPPCPTTKPSE